MQGGKVKNSGDRQWGKEENGMQFHGEKEGAKNRQVPGLHAQYLQYV